MTMNQRLSGLLLSAILTAALPATAQTTPPPPAEPPSMISRAAGDRRDEVPNVNVYLPEGQASIRLRKLIRNVLFESQIDYKFVNGDIATYLRYKYYAHNFTYRIGVFDTIGFGAIGRKTNADFERVRGGLVLLELPRDYNHRYFGVLEDDRLTFGDITRVDNRKNNIFAKFGYQYGTEFDEQLNSIVGEQRGGIVPVLTAFRELGPQKFSYAAALTEGTSLGTGDYKYTKLETATIRRFDVTPTSFLITRAHLGAFLTRSTIRGREFEPFERYSIPLYELFRLSGREGLRSLSGKNNNDTGTDEIHFTGEYFVPIFRNKDFRSWSVHWNTLYGIGYLGAGNVGYQFTDLARVRDFVVDAGIGAETALAIRDFDVLIGVVAAHTIRGPEGLKGNKVRFSIRTIR